MKKLHLSTLNVLWFSLVFIFNGCAITDSKGSSDLEGIWVSQCKESEESAGSYTRDTFSLSGTNFISEALTYSDAECSQRSSGLDFRSNGTFTTEAGGIVDGKQLTKINYVLNVTYAEGYVSLFFPVGSIQNVSYENYVDGNTMYATDGETNLLDGKYVDATQIKYDKYWVKQ